MNRQLALICVAAFLFMLGLSVLFPVLPYFIEELGMSELAAGAMMSAYAFASVLTAPLWGRFSERYGRKPALVIGLAGFAAGFLLFALGDTFWELIGARVLGGVLAAAVLPATFAYTADVTDPERRSTALGMLGASFGFGTLFGPVIGGVLGDIDTRLPFFVAAGVGAFAAALTAAVLPESLTPEIRAASAERRRTLAERGLGLRDIAVGLASFLCFSFLIQAGRSGLESTLGFLMGDRFALPPSSVGYVLFGVAVVTVVVQGGAIRGLSRRYSDHGMMITGTGLLALGLLGVGLAPDFWLLLVASLVLSLGAALQAPTFAAELSRAAESVQGEAQGLASSAQSLGRAIGPLVATGLYGAAGAAVCYAASAALCVVGLALAWRRLRASLPEDAVVVPAPDPTAGS